MPTGIEERQVFQTRSLVEAALLFMRTQAIACQWIGDACTFEFNATTEDITWAKNGKTTVIARDFNKALVTVKSAMYSSEDCPTVKRNG